MNMKKRPARLGFAAALLALLLSPLVFGAQSALAQGPTQATYYGGGHANTTITAYIGGEECDSFDTGDDGQWVIYIDEGDCNGNAVEGAEITFDVGDAHAEPHVDWAPADVQELTLTVAAMDDDAMDDDAMDDDAMDDDAMDDDAMDDDKMDDDGAMTPGDKGDTGNAGFATQSGSSSMLLVLALGVLAAAGVAGARTATGRID
ncbi:MAG: hypothetical protein OXG95_01645 [Chloroflexi bacterium]|nr:hypothetical protein [Chloroflexota bacterium]